MLALAGLLFIVGLFYRTNLFQFVLNRLDALEQGRYHDPHLAHVLLVPLLHIDLNKAVSLNSLFIPIGHLIDHFITLILQVVLAIHLRSNAKVISKLIESTSLLLIMLPIESQHVLVLANEVIVEDDGVFRGNRMLVNKSVVLLLVDIFVYILMVHLLGDHHVTCLVVVVVIICLILILDVHVILLIVVERNLTSVPALFNTFAMSVVLLTQFFVVSVH